MSNPKPVEGALREALAALRRVQPQIRGAIPVQDVQFAIEAAEAALSAAPARDGVREATIREAILVQCQWCRLTEPRLINGDGYISNFGPVSDGEWIHDATKELDYETKWCEAGYLRTWAAKEQADGQ